MLRNLIVLPDGTEISTGTYAIQSSTHKTCANSGTELTLGSVCSSMLEVKCFAPNGSLTIEAGTEIILYKVDDAGERHLVGPYTLETPERPSRNTYKFTAYDRVSRLDKDLTSWLESLDGYPYPMLTFARMVCDACGLELLNDSIPNEEFPVNRFRGNQVTGRKIMGWIGQLCARFVRATSDGFIEFAWYEHTGMVVRHDGEHLYRSLVYEDYRTALIGAVQIRLANSEDGALFPVVPEGTNSYILPNNPLITSVTEALLPYLRVIENELADVEYTPCKVTVSAALNIRAGQIIDIIDRNGVVITAYIMSQTQKGRLSTLECTGSPRRDSSTTINNPSTRDLYDYADNAADAAVKRQSQLDLFNKLTNNGQIQGLFMSEDGQVYINAEYIATGVLTSRDGRSFYLDLDTGTFYSTGKFMSPDGKSYITMEGNQFVLYAQKGENGEFIDIARIGFNSDSEGDDYPYFLMGHAEPDGSNFDELGLLKMFRNGMYLGNSAPMDSTGSFVGLAGASGLFIDTMEPRPYLVSGQDLMDAFEAVFA